MEHAEHVVIGILALQGAFVEHQAMLQKLSCKRRLVVVLVRTTEDLHTCDALIIPGGESTTIALLARVSGLLGPLRAFIKIKPVWGTCAGAILLSEKVEGSKKGGQDLLGGMSISIARNGWGSQVESFEADLALSGLPDSENPYTGIFIRAPVVLALNQSLGDPPIEIVARLPPDLLPHSLPPLDESDPRTAVALRQGFHFLTTFHPELTNDDRFHDYFIRECVFSTVVKRC